MLPATMNLSMIEAYLNSSSDPLPLAPANLGLETTLHEQLQAVLNATHEAWNYAIFWKPLYSETSGEPVLKWGDGVYRGGEADNTRRRRKTKAEEKKQRNKLSSTISGEPVPMMDCDGDVELTDTEWFYLVSVTCSFSSGSGLVGEAFATYNPVWVTGSDKINESGCSRASQGGELGLQTIVCVPLDNGVLELGSTEQIRQNSDLIQKIRLLFDSEGCMDLSGAPNSSSSSTVTCKPNLNPSPVYSQILNNIIFSTATVRSSLGEDVKLGDSDHSNVDAKTTPEHKRGRKPTHGGEEPMNHVEAERLRREKLNRKFNVLRAVVPNVLRMDRASVLEDTVTYINELKLKVENAETEKNAVQVQLDELNEVIARRRNKSSSICSGGEIEMKIDVKVMDRDAMVRFESSKRNHPGARLMNAFMDLEVEVNHASISVMNDLMIQQATVKMGSRVYKQEQLRDLLLSKIS